MNSFKKSKINSGVGMNKSYSSVLKSPSLPVPGQRGPVRCFPKSMAQPAPVLARAPSKPMPSKYGQYGQHGAYATSGGNYRGPSTPRSGRYEPPAEPTRRFASTYIYASGRTSTAPDNVPFFASNLRYYPHLPQPLRVRNYQTYSEIKEVMSKGNHSKFGPPKSAEVRGQHAQHGQHGQHGSHVGRFISRDGSDKPPKQAPVRRFQKTPGVFYEPPNAAPSRGYSKTPEFHDEPPSQAPNRRYSMTRKNGGNNGMALANLIFRAGTNLLRPSYPEVQTQIFKQKKQPVQDPLLAQFKARQEELQRGDGGVPSTKPRRLQPSWCPTNLNSKASGSSKPDAPLSWRSDTQQPVKKSAL
ncbi:hypothetical protein KR084_006925 [Drosophila pseudotakahashii]|nr:hypothetical protein KR084_006925 [Drosophila pseudotakahashii]